MNAERFIGTWRLESFEQRGADGQVTYPLGRHLVGYLLYATDGYMSVQMMAGERPRLPGGDVGRGTAEEKAAAMDTYRAYAGRYEIDGERVIHHVEISSWPNRVGTDLVRYYTLDENRLFLRTAPFTIEGVEQVSYLVWQRAAT